VLNRDTLLDAMEHPEKYPQLTIRVSGYAVNFVRLTREQQEDVLHRTFHGGSQADLKAELAAEGDPEIGYYHSYEITGSVNGPGIRFMLYPSGCPLRCRYCQNPDMWTMHNGRRVTVGRMLDEVAKYVNFVKAAHRGITVSDGEPMLQIRFVEALFRRCKQDLGLHAAVDTSGFLGARAPEDFLDLVDLFPAPIPAAPDLPGRRTLSRRPWLCAPANAAAPHTGATGRSM
jgi:sulfatase maturation enzyme AslB (radical SAM superfamily)